MLTKTLQTLIERAERNGMAVKRVREGSVMGMYYHSIDLKDTPLIEQWRVTVQHIKCEGMKYKNIYVDHYGTQIAFITINETNGEKKLNSYYGESKTDSDALNGFMEYYGLSYRFSYRPVNGGFQLIS